MNRVILLISLAIIIPSSFGVLEFLQPQKVDGIKRVRSLQGGDAALQVELAANPLIVVLVCAQEGCEFESFGESLAHMLAQRASVVPVISMTPSTGQTDHIAIYRAGKKFTYYGKRNPQTFLRFLSSMESEQTKIITGKLDKIAFDHIRMTKLVGFFVNGSAEHQVFEQASSLFSPMVLFYTVFDATVAKHLKFNTTGQISVFREFEKYPVSCPVNPATLADIQKLIVLNRDQAIVKISEFNVFDPSYHNPEVDQVLFITDNSPLAWHLRKLVTKAVRNITLANRILWLDSADFAELMDVSPTKPFHGLQSLPGLGLYTAATKTVAWFDLNQLNATAADKLAEQANLQLIKTFLPHISTQSAQTFAEEPVDTTATDGAEVTLICKVNNKIGDCLWSKDDASIGYSLSQFPTIQWVDATQSSGECSLRISAVKPTDQGVWRCTVSSANPLESLTSGPAQLTVEGAKTEL